MERLLELLPSIGTTVGVLVTLLVMRRLLDRDEARLSGHRFRNQMIMVLLTATGVLVVILVIPMGDTMRGQVLSLIGILLSAAIALSSTTVLGNAMAGFMMRAVRGFRIGDFVRVENHFGRVTERGLFHTEIQTEDRELTTLPNLYLVTHPVSTTRTSGTIVSTVVSLGYDVPRTRIKELLLQAATNAKLEDPFVHVVELGDFSVSYRVAGMLTEVKKLLSTRSLLRECVMDSLHGGGVEIVSPNFMNTRALAIDTMVIPTRSHGPVHTEPESLSEDLVFDKAEDAESLENLRLAYTTLTDEIKAAEDRAKETEDETARETIEREMAVLKARKEHMEKVLADRESRSEGGQ